MYQLLKLAWKKKKFHSCFSSCAQRLQRAGVKSVRARICDTRCIIITLSNFNFLLQDIYFLMKFGQQDQFITCFEEKKNSQSNFVRDAGTKITRNLPFHLYSCFARCGYTDSA